MGEGAIPSWARVGAKVECIDDRPGGYEVPGWTYIGGLDGLLRNRVYTVRETFVDPEDFVVSVRLQEIIRENEPRGNFERGYALARFRPLVTRSQQHDVAIFAPLLNAPHRQDEPA